MENQHFYYEKIFSSINVKWNHPYLDKKRLLRMFSQSFISCNLNKPHTVSVSAKPELHALHIFTFLKKADYWSKTTGLKYLDFSWLVKMFFVLVSLTGRPVLHVCFSPARTVAPQPLWLWSEGSSWSWPTPATRAALCLNEVNPLCFSSVHVVKWQQGSRSVRLNAATWALPWWPSPT